MKEKNRPKYTKIHLKELKEKDRPNINITTQIENSIT
jgi:hypothetical protein